MGLAAIPTLDEIVARPAIAETLPPSVVRALRWRAIEALAALNSVDAAPATVTTTSDGDDFIGVPEVARMIGLSESWVTKHTDELPQRRSVAGNPRWVRSEIRAWQKSLVVYGALTAVDSSTAAGVSGRRRSAQ